MILLVLEVIASFLYDTMFYDRYNTYKIALSLAKLAIKSVAIKLIVGLLGPKRLDQVSPLVGNRKR